LRQAQKSLLRHAQDDHGDRKVGRIPSSFDLINASLDYADAGVAAATSDFERARRLRDASMIVLLAMLPIRRKNFFALEISHTVQINNQHIVLSLPTEDMKTRARYEAEVQEPGAALLRRYLVEARPFFAARAEQSHDAIWLADTGRPYSDSYFGRRIPLITERMLGVKVPSHFFRDAVATTFARTSPELARGIKAILGHSDFRTSERHYNQARAVEAGRSYAEILRNLSEE
jgi:integrase